MSKNYQRNLIIKIIFIQNTYFVAYFVMHCVKYSKNYLNTISSGFNKFKGRFYCYNTKYIFFLPKSLYMHFIIF